MSIQICSSKQNEFLDTKLTDINILSGVTGSGKSFVANIKFYLYLTSQKYKNKTFLLTGKTSESLYKNVIKELLKLDSGFHKISVNKNPYTIKSCSGSEVLCIGMNNSGAEDRIKGGNIFLWYADEVTTYDKKLVHMALSRCRQNINGNLQIMPCIWTCNPDHPEHFIKRDYIDKENEINLKNYYFGFNDNPIISKEYIEQVKKMYSGAFYERMIMGRWVASEGVVYDMFDKTKHIYSENRQFNNYILGIDWGYEHNLAILLIGIDHDGSYYVCDEIYAKKQNIDKYLIQAIKDKGWFDLKYGQREVPVSYAYCDSARPDYIHQFYQLSKLSCIPASKDVIEGIQIVQTKLKDKGNGEYNLYINQKCKNTLREFDSYCWKSDKIGTKDEPEKRNDDAMDALRYAIFTHERSRVNYIGKIS